MKDDDEFEKLLGEIPHATSPVSLQNLLNNPSSNHHDTQKMNGLLHRSNLHHMVDDDESIKCKYVFASSPVTASGFPLTSDNSPSSSFSGGGRSHSNSSSSPPQFEPHCLDFSRNFSKMSLRDEMLQRDEFPNWDFGRYESSSDSFRREAGSAWVETDNMTNLLGSPYSNSPAARFVYTSDFGNSAPAPQCYRTRVNNGYPMEFVVPNVPPSTDNPPLFYSSPERVNHIGASGSYYSSSNVAPLMQQYNDRNLVHYQQSVSNGRNKVAVRVRGSVEAVDREDSSIVQGGGIGYRTTRARGHNNTKSFHQESGALKTQHKRSQFHNAAAIQSGYQSSKVHFPFNRPWKFSSLTEARGYMYHMAKDQQGCRFLQRVFDEGTPRDVQIIFNEIIDHAVELMMTPFGNYLMQKLLEVCTEEQKMHILFRVTEEPGELVRISLNTYGTRVVQKLIETLNTKQQISLVISALEPGFLALMKDLNGSHLIKRCLQCFPSEDSKFIFVAAAKYCFEIATHQNGCCVLQGCIRHSTGEHRENLIAEISANGLLLAEDAYGNYVVQFILEEIPYATSKLTSQFEGNYVNLSTQKFSSHVVEKCLWVCNEEARAKIIHELLSASCFDQLLQDPYANYVIQTALRISQGHVYYSLVDAIESYKAVSRNSPYSKRIFSQKLLKRDG
ncbi:hypothetical protein ACS0TY_002032 [Phlomoides rotata]